MAGELVFVTGGTGFLGHHLVPQLVVAGYRIRLLVRETSDSSWLKQEWPVELVQGDVADKPSIDEGMRGCDYVIHAAGVFRFWGEHEWFDRVNLKGTQNVAQAALEYGIKRMVHISTVAVVGDPEPGILITEEANCFPQDSYQHSKLSAEKYLKSLAAETQFPFVILRAGAFYGPGGRYAFNRLFVEEPLRRWRVKVDGGKRLTFPVFVPDVANMAIITLKKGTVGETYNISDDSITHNELNAVVSDILGISSWRLSVPRQIMLFLAALMEIFSKISKKEPFYPLNLQYYVFNDWRVGHAKAARELDFIPTPIEEGLQQTVDWFMAQEK